MPATTELTHLGNGSTTPCRSPATGEVLYGELAEHAMRLPRRAIAGGTPNSCRCQWWRASLPSATTSVFTQPQLTGATAANWMRWRARRSKVELDDSLRFDWTLSPGALWFAGRDGNKRVLVRLDLDSGQRRSIDLAPSAAGTNIAISRDGQSIIVAREAPAVVDLMIAKPQPQRSDNSDALRHTLDPAGSFCASSRECTQDVFFGTVGMVVGGIVPASQTTITKIGTVNHWWLEGDDGNTAAQIGLTVTANHHGNA